MEAARLPSTRATGFRIMARRLGTLLAALALGVFLLRLSGCAERLFYTPSRQDFVTPPGYEDVAFTTADGVKLHGWFIPARDRSPPPDGSARGAPAAPGQDGGPPPRPAVLHVHGNAGNISGHAGFSAFLTDHGISVLIFDYRGYGRSAEATHLSRDLLYLDTQAALDYLLSRPDVDRGRVGVYGVSLGGAFALRLAAERKEVRAVCTAAAFSSWQGVASDRVPVPGSILIGPGLDPVDAAARLGDKPYLIVHGDRDTHVPLSHSTRLEEAARATGVNVEKFIVPGAGHNDVVFVGGEVQPAITAFFTKNLAAPKPSP